MGLSRKTNERSLILCSCRDNVEWSEEQKQIAEEAVKKNSDVKFTEEQVKQLDGAQAQNWDTFYGIHQNRFFKDRHWLFTEFPELAPNFQAPERVYPASEDLVNNTGDQQVDHNIGEGRTIFEIGSGVGNSELDLK
jgi:hypothetical protein